MQIAEAAKAKIQGAVTEIAPLDRFWPAEEYHQRVRIVLHRLGPSVFQDHHLLSISFIVYTTRAFYLLCYHLIVHVIALYCWQYLMADRM